MCGILFCKVLDEAVFENTDMEGLFFSSLEKMKYRGEDNVAMKKINGLYFGHARLAINGLNESCNQPMVSDDHVLIFNGEYYNYKEKYSHVDSDTKALFEHLVKNPDDLSSINGPCAYGWHDKANGNTIFRRDIFGEKPLYYYRDTKVLLVSSTLKSIVHFVKGLGGKISLNIDALRCDYALNGFVREPETVWKEILELPPNHTLVLRGGEVSLKKESASLSGENVKKRSDDYFRYSLLSRDVEAALLLSSGVDSNYLLVKSIEAGAKLSLVTYGSEDGKGEVGEVEKNLSSIDLDELAYRYSALLTSNGGRESLSEEIECYASIMEQPTSDGLQVNRILQHLKEEFPNLKVVYSGLGGDEIFGGYPTFKNFKIINAMINFPGADIVVPKMKRFVEGRKILGEWGVLTYYFLYRADPSYVGLQNQYSLKEAYKRFKKGVCDSVPLAFTERYKNHKSMQIKFLETFDYCKNQLLRDIDNISMHHGVEARVPLLNPYLLEEPVDNKRQLKKYVESKTKITFGKKRGFSVLDHNCEAIYKESLFRNQNLLEKVFGEGTCDKLIALDAGSMRKFSIVAEWLKINAVICEVDGATLVAK